MHDYSLLESTVLSFFMLFKNISPHWKNQWINHWTYSSQKQRERNTIIQTASWGVFLSNQDAGNKCVNLLILWSRRYLQNLFIHIDWNWKCRIFSFLLWSMSLRTLYTEWATHLYKGFVDHVLRHYLPSRMADTEGTYRAEEKSLCVVWWSWFLLLLTTSASTCLKHSRNNVRRFFLSSVVCRQVLTTKTERHYKI